MDFQAPPFDAAIDLEKAVSALPSNAACKGMFFADLLNRVHRARPRANLFALANIEERRFTTYLDYPFSDYMRLLAAAATLLTPDLPMGEGLRRLGQHAYDALFESHVGRVIFGVLGLDVKRVLLAGAKGYRVSVNFGRVSAEDMGKRRVVFRYVDFPAFTDTYQVGVIEGAILHYKEAPTIRVAMESAGTGSFDVTW